MSDDTRTRLANRLGKAYAALRTYAEQREDNELNDWANACGEAARLLSAGEPGDVGLRERVNRRVAELEANAADSGSDFEKGKAAGARAICDVVDARLSPAPPEPPTRKTVLSLRDGSFVVDGVIHAPGCGALHGDDCGCHAAAPQVEPSEPEDVDPMSAYMNARTCICGADASEHPCPTGSGSFDPDWWTMRRRYFDLRSDR